jgi:uncharacterized membrane protein
LAAGLAFFATGLLLRVFDVVLRAIAAISSNLMQASRLAVSLR